MSLTFNIIYTPGSQRYLTFFIHSLCKYSDYYFRIVSNGCSPIERAELKLLCQENERLSYLCLPSSIMKAHGEVLDYLQVLDNDDFFCFMDSDIFAIDKLPDLVNMIVEKNFSGVFSAMPLWSKKSEYSFGKDFYEMTGTYNQMQESICLGNTYFAIYNRRDLRTILEHYGVSFGITQWFQLTPQIKRDLQSLKVENVNFDTGKLVNLLLLVHNKELVNLELDELIHIGGSSFEYYNRLTKSDVHQSIKSLLKSIISSGPFEPIKLIWRKYLFRRKYKNMGNSEFGINFNQRLRHRNVTREYFFKLFHALTETNTLPTFTKIEDEEIKRNIKRASQAYIDTFEEFVRN